MTDLNLHDEQLPGAVKDNLTEAQWREAAREVIRPGDPVLQSTVYMNLRTGECRSYQEGERADVPLLPTHNLSGGRGRDSSQFRTAPPGRAGTTTRRRSAWPAQSDPARRTGREVRLPGRPG